MPFIDGGQNFYDQLRLDEPWDSPHNIQMADLVPSFFANADLPDGFTKILGFVHADSVLPADGSSIRFGSIRDGASNTAFIVDADVSAAVEWTRPADIEFDPANPLASVGENGTSSFYVGLMDGAARMLPADVSETEMRNLVLINDGALTAPEVDHQIADLNAWSSNLYERRSRIVPGLLDRVFAVGV